MITELASTSMRESIPKPIRAVEEAAAPAPTAMANSMRCQALPAQARIRARAASRSRSTVGRRASGAGCDSVRPAVGAPGVATGWEGSTKSGPRPFMAQVLQPYVEEKPDVRIVEGVEDVPAASAVADDAPGAQEPEVVRAGGLAQARDGREIADAELATFEQGKNEADPASIGQHPEGLCKLLGGGLSGQTIPDGGGLLRFHAVHLAALQRHDRIGRYLHKCEDITESVLT